MHLRHLIATLSFAGAVMLPAQEPIQPETPAPLVQSEEALDKLLAPIALYPDALVALILPAATAPSDIVLAARQLAVNASPEAMEAEPWEDSVKGLTRYPEVLKWLDENLAWTKALGEAFLDQPADVMNAVQRLRQRAHAAGTLKTTTQQQVVVEPTEIRIVPARPDVIYVPRYDPAVVYVRRPGYYSSPFISFGVGYSVGHWLAYDCDWRGRTVWMVPRHDRSRFWRERPDWRRRHDHRRDFHRDGRWHAWQPRPHRPRPSEREHGWPHRDRPLVRRPERGDGDGFRPGHNFNSPGGGGFVRPRPGWSPREDPLPGGPTPDMAAPVGPVVDVTPGRASERPALSPNGRRLPGQVSPQDLRKFVRSPNGRLMPPSSQAPVTAARPVAPRVRPAPVAASPAPARASMPPAVRPSPRAQSASPGPAFSPRHGRTDASRAAPASPGRSATAQREFSPRHGRTEP